jgi:hypothetical protein
VKTYTQNIDNKNDCMNKILQSNEKNSNQHQKQKELDLDNLNDKLSALKISKIFIFQCHISNNQVVAPTFDLLNMFLLFNPVQILKDKCLFMNQILILYTKTFTFYIHIVRF